MTLIPYLLSSFVLLFFSSFAVDAKESVTHNCSIEKQKYGPEVFGGLNLGDDASIVFCKLRELEYADDGWMLLTLGYDRTNTVIVAGHTAEFDLSKFPDSVLNQYIWSILDQTPHPMFAGVKHEDLSGEAATERYHRTATAQLEKDREKPLVERQMIYLRDIAPDYPEGVIWNNACLDMKLAGLKLAGARWTIKLQFSSRIAEEAAFYSYAVLVDRLEANMPVLFYSWVNDQPVYTKCGLQKIELKPAYSDDNHNTVQSNIEDLYWAMRKRYPNTQESADSARPPGEQSMSPDWMYQDEHGLARIQLHTNKGFDAPDFLLNSITYEIPGSDWFGRGKDIRRAKFADMAEQERERQMEKKTVPQNELDVF